MEKSFCHTITESITITVPGDPRTKKNSQRIIRAGGRYIPIPSKQYKDYEKAAGQYLEPWKDIKISEPVNVQARYYMKTRRKVDLTNLHEALHDILVKYKVLEDDDANIIVSTDGSRVFYDKEAPRTEIVITPVHNN